MMPSRIFSAAVAIYGLMSVAALPAYAETLRQQLDDAILDYQFQDFASAETKFRTIINQAPGNVASHYYLGIILLQKGKAAEAIPYLEHVVASPADYPGVDSLLASAYLQAGQGTHALPIYKKLYRTHPGDESIRFNYARALQSVSQGKKAAPLYRSLIKSGGSFADPSRYQLAQFYSGTGSYAEAAEQLRAISPDSPYHAVADRFLEALAPVTRPLHLYLSAELFYNDNPTSASAQLTGTTQAKQGSQGLALIGMVNSRALPLTSKLNAKIGYFFYGNYYRHTNAKSSDFQGHFLTPELGYQLTSDIDLALKGELQRFYFNHQWLSNSYGATISGNWHPDRFKVLSLHGGYLSKHYTSNYITTGQTTSLQYLNANVWSIGGGGSATLKGQGPTLGVDYTFNDDRPTETASATLGQKARDSRSREHLIQANLSIPFRGKLDPFRLISGYRYSKKDFLNPQSGTLYADVTGQKMSTRLQTFDIRLQMNLSKAYSLKLTAGYERSRSSSEAAALNYSSNRYFGQLAAYY